MQFDWMVQCYAGAGVHRDAPLYEALDRDSVLSGLTQRSNPVSKDSGHPITSCSAPVGRSSRCGRC